MKNTKKLVLKKKQFQKQMKNPINNLQIILLKILKNEIKVENNKMKKLMIKKEKRSLSLKQKDRSKKTKKQKMINKKKVNLVKMKKITKEILQKNKIVRM